MKLNADCYAMHSGYWMADPRWLRAAVEAVKAGEMPHMRTDDRAVGTQRQQRVVVIPVNGPMTKGWSKFGGTSSSEVRAEVEDAAADSSIAAILLVMDTPGGTVAGTGELAAAVRRANAQKPVYAHAEDLLASAGYWVASQATSISATPTTEIGSIGTLAVVEDTSGAAEMAGVQVHVVSTGAYKGAFAAGTEVTDEHLSQLQTEVNDLNEHFLAGVAEGRGMTMDDVEAVADGRVFIASKALASGLIDNIASLDDVVAQITADVSRNSRARSHRARARRLRLT